MFCLITNPTFFEHFVEGFQSKWMSWREVRVLQRNSWQESIIMSREGELFNWAPSLDSCYLDGCFDN